MEKVLITGGAGFIGSHLSDALLVKNCEVFVIDNLSTGSMDNISHLMNNKKFHFFEDTITNKELMEELVKKVDVIFHLAAAVGVDYVIKNPLNSIKTNVEGTAIVLDLASKYDKKVLIASTSEVYGKSENVPFKESADMVLGTTKVGRWSYACSKAIDEFLALAYFNEKNLKVVITRFFNTVGPRQSDRYGMVIPRFIRQALNNGEITVYGDGSQTRCFCHVKDVVDVIIKLIYNENSFGKVFNVGNDDEVTIKELAERIIELTKSNSKIRLIPYTEAYKSNFEDMKRRVPDLGKIKSFIEYSLRYNLDDILKETISYMKVNK